MGQADLGLEDTSRQVANRDQRPQRAGTTPCRRSARRTNGAGTGDRTQDDTLDSAGNRLTAAARKGGVTTTTTFTVTKLDAVVAEARPDG
jgi:hypothetical protein